MVLVKYLCILHFPIFAENVDQIRYKHWQIII